MEKNLRTVSGAKINNTENIINNTESATLRLVALLASTARLL